MSGMDLGPRYRFVRELGKGSSGRVLLVRDTYLEKDLALKLLLKPPRDAGELEQAQREFALLSKLEHPRIARAYDFGYLDGSPYFTSEYVPGEALSNARAFADPIGLLRFATEVTEALSFLHRSEILHLDVKPSNVIVRT